LLPHEGGSLIKADGSANSIVKRKADEFNQPVLIAPSENVDKAKASFKLLEIKSPNVFLGTLKYNEWDKNGNIVARFVEGCGISTKAEISFNSIMAAKIKSIKSVDILERELNTPFQWDKAKGTLIFDIGKFEICTFEFKI
jgi:hypothetical protein